MNMNTKSVRDMDPTEIDREMEKINSTLLDGGEVDGVQANRLWSLQKQRRKGLCTLPSASEIMRRIFGERWRK